MAIRTASPMSARWRDDGLPLIGITGARIAAATVATTPPILLHTWLDTYYAHYAQAVARAGGTPVMLSRESAPGALASRLDGLVVAGGHDVDPRLYGSEPTAHSTRIDPGRDRFEVELVNAAIDRGVPIVGICRGAQLLNVARGGTLIDDLRAEQRIEHTLVLYPAEARVHPVELAPGSRLAGVYGAPTIDVNSFHHQGIAALGDGVRATGRAPDGIIEAIELEDAEAIGVQWHPELLDEAVEPLFAWLVQVADRDEGGVEMRQAG